MDAVKGLAGNFPNIFNSDNKRNVAGNDFVKILKSFYTQVDKQLREADQNVEEFTLGKSYDLHEIMITSEKADISLKLLLKIRNKLLESYQEIMRMQF